MCNTRSKVYLQSMKTYILSVNTLTWNLTSERHDNCAPCLGLILLIRWVTPPPNLCSKCFSWHYILHSLRIRFPGVVELHLCLLITPKWLQGTAFPAKMEPFKLTSSRFSWQCIHIGKLETLFYSCSTKAQEGSSFSLTRCRVAVVKLLPVDSCGCWPSAS